MDSLTNIKKQYNHNLVRFSNGCEYIGKHMEEKEKYLPELMIIVKDLGLIVDIMANNGYIMTDTEIEKGFINI